MRMEGKEFGVWRWDAPMVRTKVKGEQFGMSCREDVLLEAGTEDFESDRVEAARGQLSFGRQCFPRKSSKSKERTPRYKPPRVEAG